MKNFTFINLFLFIATSLTICWSCATHGEIKNNTMIVKDHIKHDKNSNSRFIAVGRINTDPEHPLPIVLISDDHGNNWKTQTLSSREGILNHVSCSNKERFCSAFGIKDKDGNTITYISYDGGDSWTFHDSYSDQPIFFIVNLNCENNYGQNCLSVGFTQMGQYESSEKAIFTSSDGGINWSSHKISEFGNEPKNLILRGISCYGKQHQFCSAVGYSSEYAFKENSPDVPFMYISNDYGKNWRQQKIPNFNENTRLSSITCDDSDEENCIIAGRYVEDNRTNAIFYKKQGERWTPVLIPDENDEYFKSPEGLSCGGTNREFCTSFANSFGNTAVYKTTNGGQSWSKYYIKMNNKYDMLNSISCNGDKNQYCAIVGWGYKEKQMKGLIYTSNDGGKNWQRHELDSDIMMDEVTSY